ncbi:MAG TPA: SusD/RagB family nutrient-binding outer membrane lipoprotein [Bacteroidetes bacterium]|nr:SusD/RagB family nutrient-binding outer membrane lipoprotein [Bacteroidota bacterium]
MKKIAIIKSFLLAGIILLLVNGCTKDFTEINENPNAATVVPATNVLGRGILSSAGTLFGERLDIYYTGSYAGHTAAIGLGDYEYRVDINNSMWRGMYIAMNYLVDAAHLAKKEGNDNLYAAALTLKAYDAQKTTDMWGKIPYSEAFHLEDENILYPKYDDEKTVYAQILAELKEAADLFKSGNGGDIGVGDLIYNGDAAKWRKFCNSLRLRVAIRISSVDPTMANPVITEILNNPTDYPVIESNDDNAYLWFPGVSPDQEFWYERVGTNGGTYTDQYRMNYVLINALQSNNDPRLPVYARKNNKGFYNGYKFGPTQLSDTLNGGNYVSGIGDRFGDDPAGFSPFMNCSEVSFIKAEIYQRGIVTGDAQAAYENGITLSCEENGIDAADIATFLAQPEVAWDSGTTSNLDKIYLQKWIALFKQSEEAWSEARRTDVPLMTDVSKDYAAMHNRPPFRLPYADEEKTLNTNFPTDVVETDIFYGTQVWWDTRSGVH